MSAQVRLKRLEELLLEQKEAGCLSVEALLDLLLCLFTECCQCPLKREKHVADFLDWGKNLPSVSHWGSEGGWGHLLKVEPENPFNCNHSSDIIAGFPLASNVSGSVRGRVSHWPALALFRPVQWCSCFSSTFNELVFGGIDQRGVDAAVRSGQPSFLISFLLFHFSINKLVHFYGPEPGVSLEATELSQLW